MTIILVSGPPASGKSIRARAWVAESPETRAETDYSGPADDARVKALLERFEEVAITALPGTFASAGIRRRIVRIVKTERGLG